MAGIVVFLWATLTERSATPHPARRLGDLDHECLRGAYSHVDTLGRETMERMGRVLAT
jgi:hypothetical protein